MPEGGTTETTPEDARRTVRRFRLVHPVEVVRDRRREDGREPDRRERGPEPGPRRDRVSREP
jgi:hypothetical protein